MDGLARGRGDRRHRPQERGHGHHRLRHRPGVDDRATCEGDRAPCGQDVLQDAVEDRHGVQEDGPQEADATKVDRGCRRGGRGGPSQLGFPLPVDAPLFVVDHHANSSDEWPAHAVAPGGGLLHVRDGPWHPTTLELGDPGGLGRDAVCRDRHGHRQVQARVPQRAQGCRKAAGRMRDRHRRRTDHHRGQRHAGRPEEEDSEVDGRDGDPPLRGPARHHSEGREPRVEDRQLDGGLRADASIVAKTLDGGGLRITTRASQGAVRAGVDLGEVMSSMATTKGGQGGGHAGAAGWSGEVPTSEAFAYILASIGAQARGTDDE